MSHIHKPRLVLPAGLVLIGLLSLGWYAGTFYSLVSPWEGFAFYPESAGEHAASFFAPMEWLDRRLRPEVWAVPEEPVPREPVFSGGLAFCSVIEVIPVEPPPAPALPVPRPRTWEEKEGPASAELP